MTGSTINTQSTLAGGNNALTIAGAANIDGAYTGLSSLSITGASDLGADITTIGAQTYAGAVTLSGGNRTLTGSTINTQSTLAGGNNALTIVGAANIDGAYSGLSSLSITGASDLGANITTNGAQTYAGAVTLSGGDRTLTGSTINTQSTLAGGNNALTIAGAANIDGVYTGLSSLSITGASDLGADITTAGAQTYAGAVSLSGGNRTLTGSTINTQSTLAGGSNAMTIAGAANIDGAYTGLSSLSISGTTDLGANITTTGLQTYMGSVTLTADATLQTSNSDVEFRAAVDGDVAGARALSIRAGSGTVKFQRSVGANQTLSSLSTVDAPSGAFVSPSGKTVLGADVGSIRTAGDQVYNNLTFNTNSSIAKDSDNVAVTVNTEDNRTTEIYPLRLTSTSGALNFVGTVEGGEYAKTNMRSLFLNAGTNVTFNSQVGFDAVSGNGGDILANYTRHYGVYRLDVTAPRVNILANITAYEHINIHGDAYIGGHTGSSETRFVFSLDPAVNFFGRVDGDGLVDGTYSLDVRAIAFDPNIAGLAADNPAQPVVNFANDVGSQRMLAGLTTQVAAVSMANLRGSAADSLGWSGGAAPRNQGDIHVPTQANAGTIFFGGNVTTAGSQSFFANNFVLSNGGPRGTEFNGSGYDITVGAGGFQDANGSRARLRFQGTPPGSVISALQRAGVSITSLPSDGATEFVKAREARELTAAEDMDQSLDRATAQQLPSVKVGDLVEMNCDVDENNACRIPLPRQISQTN